MEAQSILDYPIHQNPQYLTSDPSLMFLDSCDRQQNQKILTLISSGCKIFTFDEIPPKVYISNPYLPKDQSTSFMNQRILTYNRKSKSLEELSKKFIQHFQGKGNNIIELDKITLELGVQRRRIYDVINILQSLNVVTKRGKNNYQWKGLYQAVRTINNTHAQQTNHEIQNIRKEKSLEYLASGFLKLFINWKPAISLQQAAKEMMKDMDEASVKTKIRRLYDIINVFRSLGLVKKTSLGSKKPGYEWAGTEYLQHLIVRKQYADENTRLTYLNQDEQVMNPEERSSPIIHNRNNSFSPLIFPMLQKSNLDYFKLINETKQSTDEMDQSNSRKRGNNQFCLKDNQFPVFRKATSAFSLVAQGIQSFQ